MLPDEVIKSLLIGAAPERRDDIDRLWRDYQPKFRLAQDRRGTRYGALDNEVIWDSKTVAHDWIVTFAAWPVFCAYCPQIIVGRMFGEITNELISDDTELESVVSEFDSLCYDARGLRESTDLDSFPWPPTIPKPLSDRAQLSTTTEKFCFDVTLLAIAATFLHEVSHVIIWTEKRKFGDVRDEERECDRFSREFLLAKVAEYSSQSAEDEDLVLMKRLMGLATAAFIIDEGSRDGGDDSKHPPSGERYRLLVLETAAPGNNYGWVYTAALMIAGLRRRGKSAVGIRFKTFHSLCLQLADVLDA